MKKAFTMVELAFVIVITGLLASVSIPKLTMSRTDAEVAKIVVDIKNTFDKINSIYISNSSVNKKLNAYKNEVDSYLHLRLLIGNDSTLSDFEAIKRGAKEHPWAVECLFYSIDNSTIKFKTMWQQSSISWKKTCNALYLHPTMKEWIQNGIQLGGDSILRNS
ncbi:transformation system protein [Campylobacter fetus]|nr:transformation system protein [Campylobacter fetus]EJU9540525.1 hypothetical protein [Campylobacter fetus]